MAKAQYYSQALAGMIWSKQYFFFDLDKWLEEHGATPLGDSTVPSPRDSSKWGTSAESYTRTA